MNTALFGDAYLCRLKKTDIIMITTSRFFKEKQYMWYKVRELQSKGLNKTQIGKHLGVDRSTVRRYLQMSREDFVRRRNSHRKYTLKLAGYEEYVRGTLEEYPYISAARIHDWLKECYPDFPEVCDKTVFNFVEKVRCKYGIGKKSEARIRRDYEKLPDTPTGSMRRRIRGEMDVSGKRQKHESLFFAIVLARSRYKFTFFARRPFDTELAIYAHECAFEYFGGKPEKILYDQDRVLISRENLGDLMLTRKFQTFVREQHFQPVFCHKADPESKGKVENVVKYVKENFLVARVFRDIDSLNREALEWLERTGNGKVHGTTRLVPREEFAVEKGFLMPYHGTPQPPQEEMREYHVRKDNTVQYRGNYYSLPCGTYRSGQTTVWLQETEGNVELYNKDTGKLICRHALCTRKGRTVYDDSHRKPRNAGVKIAERILVHVSGNREVAMWMDNLKRRKERYYRDNLEVILRIIPGYDKNTLIEAIRICLDKGIYNGDSVKSLCEYVCRGKENGTEIYGLEDRLPRQGGLIQSYNEILRDYDKT